MIRPGVRTCYRLARSALIQGWLLLIFMLAALGWAYLRIASAPEHQLMVLGAGLAAIIAVWGVLNQWAISRRHATVEFIRFQESDKDCLEALRRFNELFDRAELNPRRYARAAPTFDELPEKQRSAALADWMADREAIRNVLNQDEIVAVGIRNSTLDYRVMAAWQRSALLRRYAVCREYIDELRIIARTPTLYVGVQNLAERLSTDDFHFML